MEAAGERGSSAEEEIGLEDPKVEDQEMAESRRQETASQLPGQEIGPQNMSDQARRWLKTKSQHFIAKKGVQQPITYEKLHSLL